MHLIDGIGHTPLVALRHLPAGCHAPIWVKCEHLNPGGSIKDRTALAIILDAEVRGALTTGQTIVEATAGNTGVGLALVAASRGYRVACVMPEKMSADKRDTLRALGVELHIVPNAPPTDPASFQRVAERMARERGWLLADQFRNPANIFAHEEGTASELLDQTEGRIGAFVAGAGTGGTITGVARRLRREGIGARVVLADPLGSRLTGWINEGALGADGSYAVEGIGASEPPVNLDRGVIDEAIQISDEESFATAAHLIRREGLLVGGSAGTAVAAAIRLSLRPASAGLAGPIVVVLPDGWDRYRSKPWLRAILDR